MTSIFRQLLQLNGLLALGAASIVAATAQLCEEPSNGPGCITAFLLIAAVYNFDRIADRSSDDGRSSPERSATVRRLRGFLCALVPTLLIVAVLTAASQGMTEAFWTALFPILGVGYILPVLPPSGIRPKDIPYLKCFYTALCWGLFVQIGASFSGLGARIEVFGFGGFVVLRMFCSTYLGDPRAAAIVWMPLRASS